MKLSWNAVAGATDYEISGGPKTETRKGTSAVISGLTSDTEYQFSIIAKDASGQAKDSASVAFSVIQTIKPAA